jgi:hypothetical protein
VATKCPIVETTFEKSTGFSDGEKNLLMTIHTNLDRLKYAAQKVLVIFYFIFEP